MRGKNWNKVFRRKALKGYEPVILKDVRDLIEQIAKMSDKSADLHPILNCWGYATLFFFHSSSSSNPRDGVDFISSAAFGLENQINDGARLRSCLKALLRFGSVLCRIPWTLPLYRLWPGAAKGPEFLEKLTRLGICSTE